MLLITSARKTSARKVLEDIDSELINNLLDSLKQHLETSGNLRQPVIVGINLPNHDFDADSGPTTPFMNA